MEPNRLVIIALLSIGSTVLFGLHSVEGGVPLKRYESLMKQESPELGLYNASDKVVVLTDTNFKAIVLGQNHSSLVEFYNSYCGHCRRFAPYYKMLADELYSWRDILTIGAIDCAAEENNDICREYEVMAYPSLRYFGLDFQPSASDYGKRLETQDLDGIRTALSQWIVAENSTKDSPNWPNFHNLSEKEADDLLEGIDKKRQYTVLVYEAENSTIGIETILHFQRYPDVQVRRVTDTDLAAKFQIDGSRYKIAIVDKKLSTVPYSALAETSRAYKETIESYLRAEHVTAKPDSATRSTTPNPDLEIAHKAEEAKIKEILKYVHSNKHLVYQADLEMAVRSTLFNEIPKVADISGEKLLALQRYLAVLQRYNPLGPNGRSFVSRLYEFVMQRNQHLNGKDFEDEVNRLDKQLEPIFSAKHYVGCSGSKSGLRGFTCSVWQLFHFMTVQAANNDHSQDPLEVLQAMHGFVKYFFGCTDCSEHFQAMATRRKIWSTPNKDEAVLWLWAAHNEVNQRLAGDATEDPEFPKIQFPSRASCSQCYKQSETSSSSSAATLDINWNKDAVLSFLKNIHNPEYVSRFGVENENVLQPTLEKLRQKRMIGNVFSDMDMRMGMLLYGFCILMMVVAFKLFAFKGYRKKPYGHDLLGKV